MAGSWYPLQLEAVDSDELDDADRLAAVARVAARRYGILSRDILERECPAASWGSLFGALRRMELAGELASGQFFLGLDGPQFMSREGLALFADGAALSGIWALNACDPAAFPAGGLPRLRGTRLAWRDGTLAGVSLRTMKDAEFRIGPDDPDLPALARALFDARPGVRDSRLRATVRTVNGQRAADSPYAPALRGLGFEPDRGSLTRW